MNNKLTSTSDLQTCCCNDSVLTINDDGVGINIQPFIWGCKLTPNRQCKPIPFVEPLLGRIGKPTTPWNKYAEPFADIDERILTEESYFICTNSGSTKVNIADPGQDDVRVGDEICDNSEFYAFIEATNEALGPMDEEKLANIKLIIDAFLVLGDGDKAKLSYILSTAYNEALFLPLRESDFQRTDRTDEDIADDLADWYVNSPDLNYNSPPAFTLPHPVTGEYYFGRGFVQLTHHDNYENYTEIITEAYGESVDLVNNPALVLNPEYASFILVHGMMNGEFTSRQLDTYINDDIQDFEGARAVVNGSFKAQEFANSANDILREYNELVEDTSNEEADDLADELADIDPWDRKFENMRPEEKLIAVDGAVIFCPNALPPPTPRIGPI